MIARDFQDLTRKLPKEIIITNWECSVSIVEVVKDPVKETGDKKRPMIMVNVIKKAVTTSRRNRRHIVEVVNERREKTRHVHPAVHENIIQHIVSRQIMKKNPQNIPGAHLVAEVSNL